MRMIDADALHAEISSWPESIMYKDWVQSAIASAPTLTQPNEPLTWEELKQMAGEPVYIVEPKKSISSAYWVLIDEVDEKSMWCVVGIGSACLNFYKTYGKTWMAYRRPPDEAVDMVMERLEALRDE